LPIADGSTGRQPMNLRFKSLGTINRNRPEVPRVQDQETRTSAGVWAARKGSTA